MSALSAKLKKSVDAVRKSQQALNQAIAREGADRLGVQPVWPENPSDHFLQTQLPPLENEDFRFPRETKDGLILDYDKARAQLPHFRKYFDAIQRWEQTHDNAIASLPVGMTPKALAVMQETMEDMDQEGELLSQHVKKMKHLIAERLEDLENKRDNLLDIKIKDLVEEYPEWMEEIKKEASDFTFSHPEDEDVPWHRE